MMGGPKMMQSGLILLVRAILGRTPNVQDTEEGLRSLVQTLAASSQPASAQPRLRRRRFRLKLSFGAGDCVFVWPKRRESVVV